LKEFPDSTGVLFKKAVGKQVKFGPGIASRFLQEAGIRIPHDTCNFHPKYLCRTFIDPAISGQYTNLFTGKYAIPLTTDLIYRGIADTQGRISKISDG
jgi:hypothetical protein